MSRITKSGSYCCDGCQWTTCEFLKEDESGQSCRLFGGATIFQGKSLNICNKNYGSSYEGDV